MQDELRRLPGVGDVSVLGAGQYAMRIWLNPDLLQARGLTPQDVINVIQQQSQEVAAGQIGAPPAPKGQDFQYTLDLKGRLDDPREFENIIVKVNSANGGRITRIRDVGHAELGAQTYSESFNLDGRPAAGIAVSLLPDANAIAVANEVKAKMDELAKAFPQGLNYVVPYDTTKFVKAAIAEVYRTLFEAAILVLIVILVFLQDWRAMLVPATTVPVTLIGAFAAMAALGFSINLPTLFAIVLAIGIVVDDAIVIVEGVARYVEAGDARPRGGRPGDGRPDRSGPRHHAGPDVGVHSGRVPAGADRAALPAVRARHRVHSLHQRGQRPHSQAHAKRAVAEAAEAARAAQLFFPRLQRRLWRPRTRLHLARRRHDPPQRPGGRPRACSGRRRDLGTGARADRVPADEDQGYLIVAAQLPDGASKERTDRVLEQIQGIASKVPGVEHVVTVSGISILDNRASLANAGVAFVVLKDWDVRLKETGQDSARSIFSLNGALQGVPEAFAFAAPPAADSGHRQRRRLHHAGRAEERRFRLCAAAEL